MKIHLCVSPAIVTDDGYAREGRNSKTAIFDRLSA